MHKLTQHDCENLIGEVNAGYTIIQARVKRGDFSDSDNYGIVLAKNGIGNYVTWEFKLDHDNMSYDFYWGHYYANEDELKAFSDYNERDC